MVGLLQLGLLMSITSKLILGSNTVVLNSSANATVDLAALLHNPIAPLSYQLLVSAAVLRGATDTTLPAIDAQLGVSGAKGYWFIYGDVYGAGGDGGDAEIMDHSSPLLSYFTGAGGGGAGAPAGIAGAPVAGHPLTNANNGTTTTGGTGGVGEVTTHEPATFDPVFTPVIWRPGGVGGDAVWLDHEVTALVFGNLRGGGGGGDSGAPVDGAIQGLSGGDLDQDGGQQSPTLAANFAGYAVRLFGSGAFSWSGPGVVGTVAVDS